MTASGRAAGAMARADSSIGDAFARVAETFGRLVAQHLTLLRTEIDTEARRFGLRARATADAVGRALPFAIAGIVLGSFALAELLAFALEGALGRLAHPVALLLVGTAETVIAIRWLRRAIERAKVPAGEPLETPSTTPKIVEAPPPAPADVQQAPDGAGSGAPQASARNPREMNYGAVGRA